MTGDFYGVSSVYHDERSSHSQKTSSCNRLKQTRISLNLISSMFSGVVATIPVGIGPAWKIYTKLVDEDRSVVRVKGLLERLPR
jgi:hypothetical protein